MDSSLYSTDKFYTKTRDDSEYLEKFQREFTHMDKLYKIDPEHYCKLFPRYYCCNDNSNSPSITMDRIKGITLEKKLKTGRMLSNPEIYHLFDQIDQAQRMLIKVNMLQLDLNPGNIIIVNNQFDLRLIDLTEACYLDDPNYNQCRRINVSASVDIPISLQLRQAGALLLKSLLKKTGQSTTISRCHDDNLNKYPELLQCLKSYNRHYDAEYDDEPLYYWDAWMRILKIEFNY